MAIVSVERVLPVPYRDQYQSQYQWWYIWQGQTQKVGATRSPRLRVGGSGRYGYEAGDYCHFDMPVATSAALGRPHGRYRRTFEPHPRRLSRLTARLLHRYLSTQRHMRTRDARGIHVACVTAHSPTARHIDGGDHGRGLRHRGLLGCVVGARAVAVQRDQG